MSSSSFATAASPPTGGCSPPSSETAPRAFATGEPLLPRQLRAAPLRWAQPSRLREPLPGAKGKLASGLSALQLHTVGDLLEHLPRDRREARSVVQLRAGEQATVAVEVRAIAGRTVRARSGTSRRSMRGLVEATVFDDSGSMRATFFNQPWLVERYPPGTRLILHGKADGRGRFRVSHHAVATQLGGVEEEEVGSVAHYPATEGVSSTQILTLVRELRERLADVPDPLPARIRAAEGLPARGQALAAIHFPVADRQSAAGPTGQLDAAGALRRLAFDELLLCQLAFFTRRGVRERELRSAPLADPPALSERWLERSLPFSPTGDQLTAIAQVGADLGRATPMQRLLMGEVGSGKTVVALWAMLRAVEHGRQAALMAPTETLAQQHFATIQSLLGGENVAVALLTGSTAAARRADTLAKLGSGELGLVVGTHALIEPDVVFRDLAVAVVDEQHRFGVRQRTALERGGTAAGGQDLQPHVLHMTATPIPRTLAVARHGDLDCSVLRELPRGRQPIATRIVSGDRERAEAYALLREQLALGRQAYVVCPLVHEAEADPTVATGGPGGDAGEARAATAEYERLASGELAGHTLELLHGQMRPREKQQAMQRFASGEADVLVATTVIEVGVDVPNATVMLVENAERFGISQLHQLRGRVGRGEHASLCLLAGPPGSARLRALAEHSDGFRLAEIDLRLRKEGELIGTRQSGLGQFRFATLPDDAPLLERARAHARAILAQDPALNGPVHGALGEALLEVFGADALSPLPA
ncbi:MAG TPA: ATP-dependent DNA helicase RecG [Solirubrobacteraceae bacterium]|nr:ATP-dependent DNA helicase RecG [Solirubrobacteraceae bacterium]